MGGIQGEIGVVKTKRFVPFKVEEDADLQEDEGRQIKTVSFRA